ncbi:PREDICTED: uncharacterized protein LOC106898933 isoform X4 [Calidris pugnax]|uniref:uncharacterized protein LOC106898933 isoform X3 n=1 Tax=Calidris pugnax TaxID=198806 RepID=UPI00071DFDB4|nr:PREDICTED: uncharacterized protein LOC106898933 isoform X3 [Calidris pugnax]XP_014816028.1 PREDICTED: uncharacterized protein LOC106898933 isoform X4 [Calidris pugnax]
MFLFASGVTGQQSTMAQQGWSLSSILHTVLAALYNRVSLAVSWRIRKLKQKGRSLLADAEEQKEKAQLQELIVRLQEENERLEREHKLLKTQRHKDERRRKWEFWDSSYPGQ